MPIKKKPFVIALIVIVLIFLILVITPFFINVDRFRPEIQDMLSEKLGRKVQIGHLSVSLLEGSLVAEQITIADAPAFSREPFLTAKSLAVGVDMMPLIFSRQLHVHALTFNDPHVQLLRTASGDWNFATLGAAKADPPADPPASAGRPAADPSGAGSALQNFTVDRLNIADGTIAFGRAGQATREAYEDVNITAQAIALAAAFPVTFDAKTPGGGKLNLAGKVGPIGQADANRTPFSGQLKADGVPAEDVQNLLAVLGYGLPQGSALKGGTIHADLALHGPLDRFVTQGPVQLSNVTLAGYSLVSKLGSVLGQAGGANGSDTFIQVASSKLRYAPEGLRADDLSIVIPLLGSLTGSGTVSADNRLDFRLVAKLAGNSPLAALTKLPIFGSSGGGGLPFRVQGTTSDPKIIPEIAGLKNSPLNQLTGGKAGGIGGILGGLLKKKKPHQ